MRRFFNPFSFDASVNYRDANCRKKVHEVVLIHGLISRQLPFCVFDDAFNLVHGRFDTKSFRFKSFRYKSKSIRYKCKVDSIKTAVIE